MDSFSDVPEAIKEKMNAKGELVKKTNEIFQKYFVNAVKPIYVSEIVNGEIIKTSEDNIFIDEDELEDPAFDEMFSKMQKFCSKDLYEYQQKAIKKIVQLERRGYNINRKTAEKIISNGWLLSLPIGSGKSIVFEFLSIFFRDVPLHPIIISTDGKALSNVQHCNFDKYPFFYENCAYIEKDANSVVVMKGYERRNMTVILTHSHLIEQMMMYFAADFPSIVNKSKPRVSIKFTNSMFGVDIDKLDILVIEANSENVRNLVALSYQKPFMRVIIDDYTSMNDVDNFRQILASSTIFVSGSKFQRKASDIPPSYYTLKHIPVNQISVVGHPEDTLQGILRDNIATLELMGNSCEFNTYNFVNILESVCNQAFKSTPGECYPMIKKTPKISSYISLAFIINHIARVKSAILNVEKALAVGKLKPEEVSYYTEWKNMLKNPDEQPPSEIVEVNGRKARRLLAESANPLYNYIYSSPTIPNNSDGNAVVDQKCYICGCSKEKHLHYGMVSTCCGAFICHNCLKCCTTRKIINRETGESIHDHENYYCVCCREKNSKYIFNVNHKRNSSNVHSYYLANEYFDTSALKSHQLFDYYFYMTLEGFTPLNHEGPPININKDISLGIIPENVFKKNIVPSMDRLLPVDQLSLQSLHVINKCLHDLNLVPKQGSIILIYNCPYEIQDRVRNYYEDIIKSQNKSTMIALPQNDRGPREAAAIQPLSRLSLEFKSRVSDLIGLHKNIIAIIQWVKPERADEVAQLVGRCLRLNDFGNKLYFYLTTSSTEFE